MTEQEQMQGREHAQIGAYWDRHIKPDMEASGTPPEGLAYLRASWINAVLDSPEALRQIAAESSQPTATATVENALIGWFHGSEEYPYTAPGHSQNATDCWHCEEAASIVIQALRNQGTPDV